MKKTGGNWPWYAVGMATTCLFCILLAFRLGITEKHFSRTATAVAPIQPSLPSGDAWMNISQGGRKIGYARRTHTPTESGSRSSEHIFMQINTMGIVQPLVVRTEAELKADRTLSSFQFDLRSNLFRFNARGEVAGKKLTIHVGTPGDERESVVDLAEPPYLGGGVLESLGSLGLKPGEERTLPVFDPASLGQRPVRITLLGDESLTIMGQTRQARKLSVDFLGMKQFAWIDQHGSVLREEGILGIVLEKVTREEALAGFEEAVSADLTEMAAVPSSASIADTAVLKVLKVRLDGLSKGSYLLDGGRQEYRNGVLTIRRESPSRPHNGPEASTGDFTAFLASTPFIQSDHPKIRQKLTGILTPGDPDEAKAEKLVGWVHRNLQKRPVLSVPNAVETLENGVGDCNEHAVLLAALARASGMPADVEAGVVYLNGRFFYHAWNLLYLKDRGTWVTADAVLGQMPADVTHIRFVRGDSDRQLDLVGLIGRLKIDVLEMQ